MLTVGKQVSENTRFTVCQDHFDMESDISEYRASDGRPVLKKNVIPHLKLNDDEQNISLCGPSAHNLLYEHKSNQTNVRQYRSIETQTDPTDLRTPLSLKRKMLETIPSFGSSSAESSFSTKSGSTYEPTLSDIEEEEAEAAEELDESEEETDDEFDDSKDDVDRGLSERERAKICEFTVKIMLNNLSHYTGIPQESSYVIELISEKSRRNVLLVLRKIRHNESLTILGDIFGISRQHASRIFAADSEKIATCLQPFIYWPEKTYIQRNLPLQFKHKYKEVEVIIDCFETSIGKPGKPLDQALSWSQYKHSNTVKHLLGCTPDGIITFISKGFLGRISDNEIVRRSGFLNFISKGTVIMADRGFKDLQAEISLIDGVLIKPPSVTAGVVYTSEEAKLCKSIAATRIHVERVIGKIRRFAFLKPQNSLLSSSRTFLIEYALTIASAICNMQGLLTKI